MANRSVLDDLGRQAIFVKVETMEIKKAITRYRECFWQEGNQRIHEKNKALHGKLEQLKNRFKTLRAVREVRSIVFTLDEDLRDMQAKMRALSIEIDAARMRKNSQLRKSKISCISFAGCRCSGQIRQIHLLLFVAPILGLRRIGDNFQSFSKRWWHLLYENDWIYHCKSVTMTETVVFVATRESPIVQKSRSFHCRAVSQ
jgi:hypothetical protein